MYGFEKFTFNQPCPQVSEVSTCVCVCGCVSRRVCYETHIWNEELTLMGADVWDATVALMQI